MSAIGSEPIHKFGRRGGSLIRRPQRTLPNNPDSPPAATERAHMSIVTVHILSELAIPEDDPGLRLIGKNAASVAVPETAVHENDCMVFGKHNIRTACQIFPMHSKADAHAMQRAPQLQLGRCVLAAYPGHMEASVQL